MTRRARARTSAPPRRAARCSPRPVVEEKEAGERRLRLARQQLAQQADQLSVALLLGSPPRHAGDLEGVRVVAQHQLVTAAERHAGGHVKVPAHVAAGVVGVVLFLVNLQQDVAPRGRQGKVREGVGRLRFQIAAAEGQVLVLKGDLRVAECLVHLRNRPMRQAYDYWQELPLQETCCFART